MTKRDKLIAARIPKNTDEKIKNLLKSEKNKHRTYSDIVNMALENYIYKTPETNINDFILDGDQVPPPYGDSKHAKKPVKAKTERKRA